MGIVGGGGQAELATVHERQLIPVPENLSWPEAGGAPEVFTTAHDAIFTQAELQSGERLLVHGGAGGVGTAAIQLGRAAGAQVFATVRNAEVRDQIAELGATVLAPDEFTDHGPYDVILELVGAPNMPDNLNSLNTLGRITVIGIGAGAKAEVHLGALMGKRGRIHGSMVRARPLEEKALTARAFERSVLPLLASGEVEVLIADTYPLDEVNQAYDRFTGGGKLGKIVLTM
jgi:NADPH:quinone reductase-like Zn-dependent oxidoreductase